MQNKLEFFIEDYVDDNKRAPMIIRRNDGLFEKYDFNKKEFIRDYDLARIYVGSLSVTSITEDDANKAIDKYTKRFYS